MKSAFGATEPLLVGGTRPERSRQTRQDGGLQFEAFRLGLELGPEDGAKEPERNGQ